jgi:endonuclease III related protein
MTAPFAPKRRLALADLTQQLLKTYGPQGWWPLMEHQGNNPTLTGRLTGYHPGDYTFPRTEAQRFEICCGAILTQNTAWPNVEKALVSLRNQDLLSPKSMLAAPDEPLQQAIRSSGYFRAKARKLRAFCEFHRDLAGRTPSREQLLAVWGIGPETADSILLYAYAQTEMVIDAYTLRVLHHHGYLRKVPNYAEAKTYCERHIPRTLHDYQDFHALMVEHAKRLGNMKTQKSEGRRAPLKRPGPLPKPIRLQGSGPNAADILMKDREP